MAWKRISDEVLVEEAADLAGALIDAGSEEEKVVAAVAAFLDAVLPMEVILPAPWGGLAEKVDGPVLREGVEGLVGVIKALLASGPEQKAARKARRDARRAKRQAKREERKD